jgi:hypothetical protein
MIIHFENLAEVPEELRPYCAPHPDRGVTVEVTSTALLRERVKVMNDALDARDSGFEIVIDEFPAPFIRYWRSA